MTSYLELVSAGGYRPPPIMGTARPGTAFFSGGLFWGIRPQRGPGKRRGGGQRQSLRRRQGRAAEPPRPFSLFQRTGQRTGRRRSEGRWNRPTLAHGWPSRRTTSAVKSAPPLSRDEPTA